MAQDLTNYLNDAKAKLGNEAVQNRAYPSYLNVGATSVTEYLQQDGGILEGNTFMITKTIGTYPFNNVPDSVANQLKAILDYKIYKANLNKGISTPKP